MMQAQEWLNIAAGLWPFVSAIAAGLAAWAAWSMRQLVGKALANLKTELESKMESYDTRLREELGGRLNRTEERVQAQELRISRLPTEEEFQKLTHEVGEIGGDMKGMSAQLTAIQREAEKSSHQITRIESFLLNGRNS